MKEVFKKIRQAVEGVEKEWQKDIDDEKNPILKDIKQDIKDLADIENKLQLLKLKYGISVEIKYPKQMKIPNNFFKDLDLKINIE